MGKFAVASREYAECIREAEDGADLGYAIVGLIDLDLTLATYWRRSAASALLGREATPARQLDLALKDKGKAIDALHRAKALIDLAKAKHDTIDEDSMGQVDTLYESYKTDQRLTLSLNASNARSQEGTSVGVGRASRNDLPADSSTPHPSAPCPPDREATVVHKVDAEYPDAARVVSASGTVSVEVDLTASGAVANVSVFKSAGNTDLDAAALAAARQSTYQSRVVACEAEAASYLFIQVFDPQ